MEYADLVWGDDMDAFAGETTSDFQNLEQDVLHVISEVLGSNLDDPDRGLGIVNYLGGSTVQLAQVPSLLDAQLAQDDRIASSATRILPMADGSYRIEAAIVSQGIDTTLKYTVDANGVRVFS